MAIQVFCQCGASLSVPPTLAGKKLKCKGCGTVLKVPALPGGEAGEAGEAAGAAEKPPAEKPPEKPKAPEKPSVEEFVVPEYEEVKAGEKQRVCPACGAFCAPGDAACLACGAEVGGAGEGLLGRVPRPVLFVAVALVGFALLGFVGHALWKASRPASLTREGLVAMQAGDRAAAQKAFEEALKFEPQFPEAQRGLAELGAQVGDDRLVERYAPAAIKLVTDAKQRARLRLAFARVRLAANDYKTARNEAVDAKDDDPDVAAAARGIIGLAALQGGVKDEAVAELRFAASQKSDDPRVHRELARLLLEKGDAASVVEARTAAEQSVKLEPKDAPTWLLLAELRERTDDAAGARKALEECVTLDDANAVAHARLSRLLLAAGKLDDAERESKRAVDLTPDDRDARLAMGRVLIALDRPKAAQDELEKALKLAGNAWDRAWEAEFLLGRSLYAGGDRQNGVRRIQGALDRRAADLPLALDAARLALASKDGAAAAGFLQKARANFERDYDVHLLYARALQAQEGATARNDRAIQDELRLCMNLDRDRPEAPLQLGTYLHDKLDLEQSIAVLGQGLRANPRNKELLYWKGRACIRAKRWDEAIQTLDALKAVDAGYQDADEWLRRAREGKFYEGGGGGGSGGGGG